MTETHTQRGATTILIVEDEVVLAKELLQHLKSWGYSDVVVALSGEEAVSKARERRPDLVLIDIALGAGLDGIAVASAIKSDVDAGVIYVTGFSEQDVFERARRTQPIAYITKPIAPGELERTLDMALHRLEMERCLRYSEERFRRLAENAKDMLYRMSLPDGRYEYVSPASVDIFGYTPDEFYAEPNLIRRVIHPDSRDYFQREWARLVSGEAPPTYEYWIVHKSGDVRCLHQRNTLIRDDQGQPEAIEGVVTDFTPHMKAEDALRESEQLFRSVVENAAVGVCLLGIDGGFVKVNRKMCEFVGYSQAELCRMTFDGITHEEDRALGSEYVAQVLAGRMEWAEWENRYLHKSGALVWGHISCTLVRNSSGEPEYFVAHIQDITERVQSQEAARQSELSYREIFENVNDGICIHELETGAIIDVNATLCHMYGYSRQELMQLAIGDLSAEEPPYSQETAMARIQDATRSGPQLFEWKAREKSGKVFWVEVNLKRAVLNGQALLFAMVRDISDRKATEQALKRSEAEKKAILDGITSSIVLVDRDLSILWANRAAPHIAGCSPEHMVGRKCHDQFGSTSNPCDGCEFQAAFSDGQSRRTDIPGPDGQVRGVGLFPVTGDDGTVNSVVCISKDITQEKRAQDLAIQAEKYKAVADLSSGVAHNFNNLLQIVLGNTDLALMDIQSGDFEQVESKLAEVKEASRFGAETVRRLNRFVRRVEPDDPEKVEVFDLSDAVRQVVAMSRPLWKGEPERKGIPLRLDCRLQEGCTMRGNKSDLFEVTLNLIKNAVEAMPEGGDIDVDTFLENEDVVFRVRDNGVGISEHNLHRLFTPFFTTSVEAGRGLGLSTSRTIVNAHGGHIQADSLEGQGSTFTVRLPFAVEQEDVSQEIEPVFSLRPLNILAIDDMEGTVTLLERGLSRNGHTVFTALSGEQGLELLETNPVDVVICDLGMPGLNGWQVGEIITQRSSEWASGKPKFIILTGWAGQSHEVDQIATSGVDAIVEKPVDMPTLVTTIQSVIEGS